MRDLLDVLGVALAALWARPLRALLMAVGPLLGVAVIVGAIGVLQSTDGELRAALRGLGGNLAMVGMSGARLPPGAADRVRSINTVQHVGATATVSGVLVTTVELRGDAGPRASSLVLIADPELLDVLEIELTSGRSLDQFDEDSSTTAAVIGASVAERIPLDFEAGQVLYLNGQQFGIVGVLERSLLAPELNTAVLIPRSTAEATFGMEPGHSFLYVRIDENAVAATASILPTVVAFGERPLPVVSIPTELMEARAAIDQTLAGSIIGLGFLAMVVGGFGIANVMLISVMERQREIGVRRALGHSRGVVAAQFLTEGTLVGIFGASAGAIAGVAFVTAIARARGWVFYLEPSVVVGAVTVAILVTILAALYPTVRAIRIQPLDALRAG